MSEKDFENKLKKYLAERGHYCVKYFGCGVTCAGTPDLLCCVNGYFLAVEVKADKGRTSELQKKKIKQIFNAFGCSAVISPSSYTDFESIVQALENHDIDNARSVCVQTVKQWGIKLL